MRWSYLRPFIYICDGRNIYGYKTDVSGRQVLPKRNFTINVNEDQLFDDPMVDVIVVNERNHELLLACTRDGLMSVWDPCFDEHGHNVKGEPKMLTSNHLLNDQTRIFPSSTLKKKAVPVKRKNHTVYDWDQTNGHLIVAGNVPIVRQWDAWSEKTRRDIPLDQNRNRGLVECICTNDTKDLLCVGFDCGAHNIYDLRCAKNECIMRHQGLPAVTGASFVRNNVLAVGYVDGSVRVFDTRQYQDPIEEFWADEVPIIVPAQSPTSFSWKLSTPPPVKVPSRCIEGHGAMTKFVGHEKNSLIACAMSDATIRLFDLSGSTRKPLGYNFVSSAPIPGTPTNPQHVPRTVAMQFHSHRVHLGVASNTVFATPEGTTGTTCIVDLYHAQAGL
uniref:WD_REPEATS_REGION domain-containing protein n=1 Tax=Panagrellus redivivus TaxID=6233 RepID=A0A7E5A1S8_PANRE